MGRKPWHRSSAAPACWPSTGKRETRKQSNQSRARHERDSARQHRTRARECNSRRRPGWLTAEWEPRHSCCHPASAQSAGAHWDGDLQSYHPGPVGRCQVESPATANKRAHFAQRNTTQPMERERGQQLHAREPNRGTLPHVSHEATDAGNVRARAAARMRERATRAASARVECVAPNVGERERSEQEHTRAPVEDQFAVYVVQGEARVARAGCRHARTHDHPMRHPNSQTDHKAMIPK